MLNRLPPSYLTTFRVAPGSFKSLGSEIIRIPRKHSRALCHSVTSSMKNNFSFNNRSSVTHPLKHSKHFYFEHRGVKNSKGFCFSGEQQQTVLSPHSETWKFTWRHCFISKMTFPPHLLTHILFLMTRDVIRRLKLSYLVLTHGVIRECRHCWFRECVSLHSNSNYCTYMSSLSHFLLLHYHHYRSRRVVEPLVDSVRSQFHILFFGLVFFYV